jgi:hypothetical protein
MSGEAPRWAVRVEGLEPDTIYRVGLPAAGGDGLEAAVRVRTAPERLAESSGLLLALGSCYFPSDEYWTNARAAVECLEERATRPWRLGAVPAPDPRRSLPHAIFLVGDQIYADVPRSPGRSLEGLYRGRYEAAWRPERLGALLGRGAGFRTCDDHEFWNGYPERMPWLTRSWNGQWRETARISTDAFWCHQAAWNFPPGFSGGADEGTAWSEGRLADIDFFVADGRSLRSDREAARCPAALNGSDGRCPPGVPPHAMTEAQRTALVEWVRGIERVGVLVVAQPLAQTGGTFDSALSDYRHSVGPVLEAMREAVERGRSLVVLCGDIHWGRLISWAPPAPGAGRLVEFVASPLARVGLLSILHSRFDVGSPVDPTGKPTPEELAALAPSFEPGWSERRFATGENNLGLVELGAAGDGRVRARFELWSLTTKRLARDRWGAGDRPCAAELIL